MTKEDCYELAMLLRQKCSRMFAADYRVVVNFRQPPFSGHFKLDKLNSYLFPPEITWAQSAEIDAHYKALEEYNSAYTYTHAVFGEYGDEDKTKATVHISASHVRGMFTTYFVYVASKREQFLLTITFVGNHAPLYNDEILKKEIIDTVKAQAGIV